MFLAGVVGFTATSLWCGLAQSGTELIAGAGRYRCDDGAAGGRPHLLFTNRQRHTGWRAVFFAIESLQSTRAGFLVSLRCW